MGVTSREEGYVEWEPWLQDIFDKAKKILEIEKTLKNGEHNE